MRKVRASVALLAGAVMLACNDATSPHPVTSIVISPDSGTFVSGDTVAFTAAVLDAGGHPVPGRTLVWSSSDTSVIAIGSAGVAIARAGGVTWVRASADAITDSARFTIIPAIARISVLPRRLVLVPTGSVRLRAAAYLPSGDSLATYPLTWSSSNTSVVTVSDSGVITSIGVGATLVTVSGGHRSATAQLVVRTPTFVQLEAGDGDQICGVATDSLGYCWGGDGGQFGTDPLVIGQFDSTSTPIGVPDSLAWTEIHGGEGYTCGLAVGGRAYCWGSAANGRLGNGSFGPRAWSPAAVFGGHTLVTLGVGHSVGCGVEGSGDMYCWGRNSYGELGNGDSTLHTPKATPVLVVGGITWRTIAPGTLTTCGVATDSTAYCWGLNDAGQLGVGDTSARAVPTAVSGGLKFIAVTSASQHSCGLAVGGAAYCWGYNATGALGNGTQDTSLVPVAVTGGLTFTQIQAGGRHFGDDFTCGVTTTGAAYCWGDGSYGKLGNGVVAMSTVPVPVAGGLTFASITTGTDNACGITTAGITYCWGGTFASNVPVRVAGQP